MARLGSSVPARRDRIRSPPRWRVHAARGIPCSDDGPARWAESPRGRPRIGAASGGPRRGPHGRSRRPPCGHLSASSAPRGRRRSGAASEPLRSHGRRDSSRTVDALLRGRDGRALAPVRGTARKPGRSLGLVVRVPRGSCRMCGAQQERPPSGAAAHHGMRRRRGFSSESRRGRRGMTGSRDGRGAHGRGCLAGRSGRSRRPLSQVAGNGVRGSRCTRGGTPVRERPRSRLDPRDSRDSRRSMIPRRGGRGRSSSCLGARGSGDSRAVPSASRRRVAPAAVRVFVCLPTRRTRCQQAVRLAACGGRPRS